MIQPDSQQRRPSVPPSVPAESPTQLLRYAPSGLLGGTFTCTRCGAEGWQPDLLAHATGCPYRPAPVAPRAAR